MTTLSSSNGHAAILPPPRRLGAIPWKSPSGEHYQFERWEIPGVGLRWYAVCGGLYLGASNSPDCEWKDARQFRSTQEIKEWLSAPPAPSVPETRTDSFPSFWKADTPPEPQPAILIFRAAGLRFEMREWLNTDPLRIITVVEDGFWKVTMPTAPVWRVWRDGRFLTVEEIGPELTSFQRLALEDSPDPPPPACFPTAHEAQMAIEAFLQRDRNTLLLVRLLKAVEQFEQGKLSAAIGKGEPGDPSWTVTFRPLPTAKARGGGA